MTTPIHPCLWFDGQAKAAAEVYCSLFNNSSITIDSPMVVNFELGGKKFMGLNGGPMFKINPSISIFVLCESINKTNEVWEKLVDGGKVLMPINKYDWSARYGWLQDKFGLTWQISVVNNAGDEQQIIPSMLFTNNNFGNAEAALKFYTSIFDNSAIDMLLHYPKAENEASKVLYSEFNLNSYKICAMDGPGNHDYTFNEGVSFVVDCDTQQEIDYYWKKLIADGGAESRCGWLKDKFGVSWQIIPRIISKLMSDPEKGQRVMQQILKMNKLDIEKLINA
jgi:predicted 3-demethylubiquinone-9 3-methyltransferase (glyoxalase superfamily)